MTNTELIAESLRYLSVIDQSESPTAEAADQALTRLNQLMAQYEPNAAISEIDFPSWVTQTDLDADTPIPVYAQLFVISELSLALAPQYGVTVSPELGGQYADQRQRVLRHRINQKLHPVHLDVPVGEGQLRRWWPDIPQ